MVLIVVGTLLVGRGVLWLANPHPDFAEDLQATYGWTFIALGALALTLGVRQVLSKAAQDEQARSSHAHHSMPADPASTGVTTGPEEDRRLGAPRTKGQGQPSAARRIAEGVLIGVLATSLSTLLDGFIGD